MEDVLTVCPIGAIEKTDTGVVVNEDICLGCGVCVRSCFKKSMHLESRKEKIITPVNSVHRLVLDGHRKRNSSKLNF